MTFAYKSKKVGMKATWVVLLAVAVLLACQSMAAAKPQGAFQNLTPSDRDDTMPDMKVDANDAAHIVYQAYDGMDNDIYYKTNASGTWLTTRITDDSLNDIYPKLQLDSDNNPHVTWAHWDGADYEVYCATNTSGAWVTDAVTDNDVDDNRPSLDMGGSPTLNAVSAFDANTAWAVGAGGVILKTTNGGTDWVDQTWSTTNTTNLTGVAAVSSTVAWAVGEDGLIIKTTNGGTSWAPQNSGTSQNFYAVTTFDASTAWAVGAGGVVRATTNGTTWVSQTSNTSNDLYSVTNVGASDLFAAGYDGVIVHTVNGGGLWAAQTSQTSEVLNGISAFDANTAWAVGENGDIVFTGNAGTAWTSQDSSMEGHFRGVSAVSATDAYAVGLSSTIYHTADSGTTWDEQDTSYIAGLYGIDAVGVNNAWAAGYNAMILHTTNGGTNWSKQASHLTGVTWIACESYDAVEQRSIIQVYTDAGGTWEMVKEVEMAVAVKSPSIALSDDGNYCHMAFVMQNDNYWKAYYEVFYTPNPNWFSGINVSGEDQNQLSPSIQLMDDKPFIVYQGWDSSGEIPNYNIYSALMSMDGTPSTSRLTETNDNEYDPVLNINPDGNFAIAYQGYTDSRDFYPGLIRYDSASSTLQVDNYTDVTSQVASWAVAIYSSDGYSIHMCYAGQNPDLDIYYGYLSPTPQVNSIDPDRGYPQTTGYPGEKFTMGYPGEKITVYGTDFGSSGDLYMRVLVETPAGSGNWVEQELPASIDTWTTTKITFSTPPYNYEDQKPTDGPIRIHAFGKDSNVDFWFHPLYPTINSLSTSEGWPYDIIGINGSNFDDVQNYSVVYYGLGYSSSASASYYPEWKDDYILSKIPAVAMQGPVSVFVTDDTEYGIWSNEVDFDLTLTDVEWYFAEGYTGPGFEEFLCVLNPNDTDVDVKVTYYLENLEDNFSKVYSIPSHQRFTLSVNGEVPNSNVSLRVASSGRVICERPMYFNYRGAWTGGHDVIGANNPSNEWYFAEGTTRAGFDTWLCIMNPDVNNSANVTVTYMTATGDTTELDYPIPPGSRFTIDVNKELGPDQDVSIKVASEGPPVVAERPMYFNYGGAWTGGHITMGATKPESHWYFAEGTTRADFDEWLCIGNPGAEATVASVTYFIAGESPVTQDYNVAAHSRYTVKVNDAIGPEKDVSISVVSDKPTVVERPMYFNYGGAWTGGHDVIGSNHITEGWFFAEGTNQDGFQEWLCLLNPNDTETSVQVTYILGTGELVNRTYDVGASQRYTVFVNNEVAAGSDISMIVTSELPILVERPMYFNFKGWTGGHDVIGYSPLYSSPL